MKKLLLIILILITLTGCSFKIVDNKLIKQPKQQMQERTATLLGVTSDYLFPTANTQTTFGGDYCTWANPTYAYADDTNWTTCAIIKLWYTEILELQGFGFSIPTNAKIDGLEMVYNVKAGIAGQVADNVVKLIDSNGNAMCSDYADTATHYPITSTVYTKGGATDVWGCTTAQLTPTVANSANFGIEFFMDNDATLFTRTVSLNYVKIRIYYTPAPSQESNIIFFW